MYHVKLNAEQMAFMREEALSWIAVQEDDDRFRPDLLAAETPTYLNEVAGMLQLLAKTQLLEEGGSVPIHPDNAYSLLCYVEFDGEERAADPDENITLENMLDYVQQLADVVEQGNTLRVHMFGYAALVRENNDWPPHDVLDDTVEEMIHRYGEDQGREHVKGKAMAHYDEVMNFIKQPRKEQAA